MTGHVDVEFAVPAGEPLTMRVMTYGFADLAAACATAVMFKEDEDAAARPPEPTSVYSCKFDEEPHVVIVGFVGAAASPASEEKLAAMGARVEAAGGVPAECADPLAFVWRHLRTSVEAYEAGRGSSHVRFAAGALLTPGGDYLPRVRGGHDS